MFLSSDSEDDPTCHQVQSSVFILTLTAIVRGPVYGSTISLVSGSTAGQRAAGGFSCEVSPFISSVALTRRVRQMKNVEIARVIVQASPPSIP